MERVPGRSGLGHAGMLNSPGFVFHENSLGSHPCGGEPSRAYGAGEILRGLL